MKVTVEYTGLLHIPGVPSGDQVDVEEGTTVNALLERLGVEAHHRKFIVPLVNNTKAKLTSILVEGDRVYLLLPVGGG